MSLKTRTIVIFTAVNVAAALFAVASLAYFKGFHDAQPGAYQNQVLPSTGQAVMPNPSVGHGQHPVFDCSSLTVAPKPPNADLTSISSLAQDASDFEGQKVAVHGRVVQAFPRIMGVNWFHICDEPKGAVLVASGVDWVEPGQTVTVKGTLSVDRNIGGAYIFPLYVEDAQLEGPNVVKTPGQKPINLYEL